jgi:hypothetical protein
VIRRGVVGVDQEGDVGFVLGRMFTHSRVPFLPV